MLLNYPVKTYLADLLIVPENERMNLVKINKKDILIKMFLILQSLNFKK